MFEFFRSLFPKKINYNDYDEFICFDCETTGLDIKKDEIISIGAVIIKNNKILTSQKFERFVKPTKELGSESIKIHQIRLCDLENGEKISDVLLDFIEFIGERPLVGYYLEFDVGMVNSALKRIGQPKLQNPQIEISSIYYDKRLKSVPNGNIDLRFNTIMKKLDLPILSKHDAINDAIMTAFAFIKLKNIKSI